MKLKLFLALIASFIAVLLAVSFIIVKLNEGRSVIDIKVAPSFGFNERVLFDYSIIAKETQELRYLSYISCPGIDSDTSEEKEVSLAAGNEFSESYRGLLIDDTIESQECSAVVEIYEPFRQKSEKKFSIASKPGIDAELRICKDSGCSQQASIFDVNEVAHFTLSSSVQDVLTKASLILPDKSQQRIILPSSLKLTQTGDYLLEAGIIKEGYASSSKQVKFSVE